MYKTGLCSVTFRELSVEEVIGLASIADLAGIEWGGDVHVPPGNLERASEVARLTEQKDVKINFEYHGGTLTDTKESVTLLMKEINHQNVNVYWQPAIRLSVNERLASIDEVLPWLTHVHVFHWDVTDRLSLDKGREDWQSYLKKLQISKRTRYLMIEFVKGDSKEQFLEDAEVLKELIQKYEK